MSCLIKTNSDIAKIKDTGYLCDESHKNNEKKAQKMSRGKSNARETNLESNGANNIVEEKLYKNGNESFDKYINEIGAKSSINSNSKTKKSTGERVKNILKIKWE